MSTAQQHFVYLIARRSGDHLIAPVTVGITNNLVKRFQAIQTACPFQVEIVHSLKLPDRELARDFERRFHGAHLPSRSFGEWFDIEPGQALALLLLLLRVMLHVNGFTGKDQEDALTIMGADAAAHSLANSITAESLETRQ